MKIAKVLWNIMAVVGILVTLVTIGDQAIQTAQFVLTTIQQMGSQ